MEKIPLTSTKRISTCNIKSLKTKQNTTTYANCLGQAENRCGGVKPVVCNGIISVLFIIGSPMTIHIGIK